MDTLEFYLLAVFILAAIIIGSMLQSRRSDKLLRIKIKEQWGRISDKQYKDGEIRAVSSYFKNLQENEKQRFFVDDITWNDLDMDSVYRRINSTQSSVGEEYLYALLREPLLEDKLLKERDRLSGFFRDNPDKRERLQYYIARLGINRTSGISGYLFKEEEYVHSQRYKYILLLIAFLLSPFVILLNFQLGIILFIASFFTNMAVYYKSKSELSGKLESINYMVSLINCSRRIAACRIPELENYNKAYKKAASKFRSTGFNSFYPIFYNTQNEIFEYFKILFLIELIAFESISRKVIRYRKELRLLYETTGLLDSMIAVASFRERVPSYTVPKLFRADKAHRPSISFKELYHPLIDTPVTNSIEMKKSILITGSNASGKSTFLKTAAINAIFAQTISTCLAKEYNSCYFKIYTSMALRDNLQDNESYYIAEIKSLKRILDSLTDEMPLFCIIDEVLRGTNTIERIAASSEVMGFLSSKNCICLTATHDIELVSILMSRFDNYHFQESFYNNNIVFDYKIVPGRSSTRNAIKLLETMGYPDAVVNSARQKAEQFERMGSWVTSV